MKTNPNDSNKPESAAVLAALTGSAELLLVAQGRYKTLTGYEPAGEIKVYAVPRDVPFEGTALESLRAMFGLARWCQTCEHWEGYDVDSKGFCPVFQKRTAANHGSGCTAHTSLPNPSSATTGRQ